METMTTLIKDLGRSVISEDDIEKLKRLLGRSVTVKHECNTHIVLEGVDELYFTSIIELESEFPLQFVTVAGRNCIVLRKRVGRS